VARSLRSLALKLAVNGRRRSVKWAALRSSVP
jgi:hypothetical protein